MKIALGAALFDDAPCGMSYALSDFVRTFGETSQRHDLTLIHGREFTDCNKVWSNDAVIPYSKSPLSKLRWSQSTVPRYAVEQNYDLLHWPCQILPPARTAIPTVISVWDLAPLHFAEPGWNWSRTLLKYRMILPAALHNAAQIITHSKAIAHELTRRFNIPIDKINVIFPGLNYRFVKEAQSETHVPSLDGDILYVGTNTPRKNLKLLLESYAMLVQKGIKNRLVLRVNVSGIGQQRLLNHINDLRIPRSQVQLADSCDVNGLITLYRRAAVFAFPSLYEGFGLPLIEAMACGCAVVGLNRSTIPEIIEDAGVLVDQPTPESFADGIMTVLEKVREHPRIVADKSRARALQFDWHQSVRETWSVYERALGVRLTSYESEKPRGSALFCESIK